MPVLHGDIADQAPYLPFRGASQGMPIPQIPRLDIRREDYLNPKVDCESQAGNEWFYKLVLASYPMQPSDTPPPGQFQKFGMEAWDYFFSSQPVLADLWKKLRDREIGFESFGQLINNMMDSIHPLMPAEWPIPSECNKPTLAAALACHGVQRGITLEPTLALETLLHHSDLDYEMPCSQFRLPAPAVFVPFGKLPLAPHPLRADLDGVFCFERQAEEFREISVVFAGRFSSRMSYCACIILHIRDESLPLMDMLVKVTGHPIGPFKADEHAGPQPPPGEEEVYKLQALFTFERMMFLSKLFLYASLPDVRKIARNEWTDAKKRLDGLGPKKQAKLKGRMIDLFDRVELGPERLPELSAGHSEDGYEVAPHWRRGHFRHQPCGPRRMERKLIYIQPMLVRADRLADSGS